MAPSVGSTPAQRLRLYNAAVELLDVRGVAALLGVAVATSSLGIAHPSSAQEQRSAFDVQRFRPAPGPRNGLSARGARTDGQFAYSLGLSANYAADPLVVQICPPATGDCPDQDRRDLHVVEHWAGADLLGSLTPVPRLQLGLRLPVATTHGDGLSDEGQATADGVSAFGLSDPEAELKLRALGTPNDPFNFGLAASATLPIGDGTNAGSYLGDRGVTATLLGIADWSLEPWRILVNVGYTHRPRVRVGRSVVASEVRYAGNVSLSLGSVVSLTSEVSGATRLDTDPGENAIEGDLGLRFGSSSLSLTIGGGAGIVRGMGAPAARGFALLSFVAETRDRDGDGVADDRDRCPLMAEDVDGFEDSDGCPDLDRDGDGVLDPQDACPEEKEDLDNFEDSDGCPDLDNDGDGVLDERDRCADEPETVNGYQDSDGCPDVPDTDGDGVEDGVDKCPSDYEDTDGYQDTDGCPDPDNDLDNIPDEIDHCPDQPETVNGRDDDDGCPD